MTCEPVVSLPQPHHGLLRVGPRLGRVQTEKAEEERLARRAVELRHVVCDDPDDVELPAQSPPLPAMRVFHGQHVELHLQSQMESSVSCAFPSPMLLGYYDSG